MSNIAPPSELLPIFIDIDGTLTSEAHKGDGPALVGRIEHVRRLIRSGAEVVIWSARGTAYARRFAKAHKLKCTAIGKPSLCVDDKPAIRAAGLWVRSPEDYFPV
jgi:hypothetical protein